MRVVANIVYIKFYGTHTTPYFVITQTSLLYNEPLTISPVAAQYNDACGKRSSIECVHIDRCWPQKSWRWRLRSTLNLGSDRFRCFNHRDELESTVFLPNFRLVALLQSRAGQPLVTMSAIYSTRLSTALRKPARKHVKFNQQCFSEKVALSL